MAGKKYTKFVDTAPESGGDNAQASQPAPSPAPAIATQKAAPPTKTPDEAPRADTVNWEAEFEASMKELEEGKPESKGTAKQKGEKADTPKDPLEDEINEAESIEALAAKKSGLKVKAEEPEPEEEPADEPKDEKEDAEEDEEESENVLNKWLEKAPKGYKERFSRLQKAAADRMVAQPTAAAPLAHVSTLEQLKAETEYWEHIQELTEADDAFEGIEVPYQNGKKITLETPEQIKQWRDYARRALRAVPDQKDIIQERSKAKPWEAATKIVPSIFDKDSEAYKQADEFMKKNPTFRTMNQRDFEVKLAHMIRSQQMEEDQKSGKAVWVRLAKDKDGNVILPGKKSVKAAPAKSKLPSAPSATRPAVGVKNAQTNIADAVAQAADGSEASLARLLAAEMAA